ncbi:MAG: hypothetical protein AB8B57_01350 [Congregibacter sp.]
MTERVSIAPVASERDIQCDLIFARSQSLQRFSVLVQAGLCLCLVHGVLDGAYFVWVALPAALLLRRSLNGLNPEGIEISYLEGDVWSVAGPGVPGTTRAHVQLRVRLRNLLWLQLWLEPAFEPFSQPLSQPLSQPKSQPKLRIKPQALAKLLQSSGIGCDHRVPARLQKRPINLLVVQDATSDENWHRLRRHFRLLEPCSR